MRQISWTGGGILILSGFALWVPADAWPTLPNSLQFAFIEPTGYAFRFLYEALDSNPALKTIATLAAGWVGLALIARTATLTK